MKVRLPAVALAVGACGGDDSTDATTTTEAAGLTTTTVPVGPAGPSTTAPNGEPLALRGDGLGVTEFGAAPAQVTILGPGGPITGDLDGAQTITELRAGSPCRG